MMSEAQPEEASERLRSALDAGMLPQQFRKAGQDMLTTLQKPTHIAVLGLQEVGKTNVLNMILQQSVMPDLEGVPMIALQYGQTARVIFEGGPADMQETEGLADQASIPAGTLSVVQELPLKQLIGKRLVEVSVSENTAAQSDLIAWLTQNADIAIWCSPDFDSRENVIWSAVPDRLKDNSFLALTKADQLQMRGQLDERRKKFEEHFSDEFLGLYPVASRHGIAACEAGLIVNAEAWRASGCKALTETIQRLIKSSRNADISRAELLLDRVKFAAKPIPAVEENSPTMAMPAQAAPQFAEPISAPFGKEHLMERNEVLENMLSVLKSCSDDLLVNCGEAADPKYILDHCEQATHALSTLLMDAVPDDPALCDLSEDMIESEQMIQLFRLEGDMMSAADAITVLLQLKKGISQVAFA